MNFVFPPRPFFFYGRMNPRACDVDLNPQSLYNTRRDWRVFCLRESQRVATPKNERTHDKQS